MRFKKLMEMLSSRMKENAHEPARLYDDIDVIVCRDDFKEIVSEAVVLNAEFLDYYLGKNRHCFAVVKFRGNAIDVDKIEDWKNSKEECEIFRDLRHSTSYVPCVDKEWCSKHDENLYKTALRAVLGS